MCCRFKRTARYCHFGGDPCSWERTFSEFHWAAARRWRWPRCLLRVTLAPRRMPTANDSATWYLSIPPKGGTRGPDASKFRTDACRPPALQHRTRRDAPAPAAKSHCRAMRNPFLLGNRKTRARRRFDRPTTSLLRITSDQRDGGEGDARHVHRRWGGGRWSVARCMTASACAEVAWARPQQQYLRERSSSSS